LTLLVDANKKHSACIYKYRYGPLLGRAVGGEHLGDFGDIGKVVLACLTLPLMYTVQKVPSHQLQGSETLGGRRNPR